MKQLIIYTDGASRGNPGKATCGFVILDGEEVVDKKSFYIGEATNNEAEYEAIIRALKNVKDFGKIEIKLFSDSELVIKQINGEYKINMEHLMKKFIEVHKLINNFGKVEFRNVKRDNKFIEIVDFMVNVELDKS